MTILSFSFRHTYTPKCINKYWVYMYFKDVITLYLYLHIFYSFLTSKFNINILSLNSGHTYIMNPI